MSGSSGGGATGCGRAGGDGDRCVQRFFLALDQLVDANVTRIGAAILFLFDLENIRGALRANQQMLAVLGFEESRQRLDAFDDQHQIVLIAEGEDSIDEIVALALLAEIDLEAVGEEGEEAL